MYFPEDFLHYLWENRYIFKNKLTTVQAEEVEIIFPGYRNVYEGPDFLEAKIRIDDKIWAGHVEIHYKSSDWYAHGHEQDPLYDTVILHVVYQHDMPVFNSKDVEIPVLSLNGKIPPGIFNNYNKLFNASGILKCSSFPPVDDLSWKKWLERLYVERLNDKQSYFIDLLNQSVNDWEGVLYRALLKYFGMLNNTTAFDQIGSHLDYKVFRKYKHDTEITEALLLGTAGLLESPPPDDYMKRLYENFQFLKNKHALKSIGIPLKFGRMRPVNFPTVRLSQFAVLYRNSDDLFERLMQAENMAEISKIFHVHTTSYWETHYLPGKTSAKKRKFLGKTFVNSLIINVVAPIKFAYARYISNDLLAEQAVHLSMDLPPENNRIVRIFQNHGITPENASESQGLLKLYHDFCTRNNCLNCAIGKKILNHNGTSDR